MRMQRHIKIYKLLLYNIMRLYCYYSIIILFVIESIFFSQITINAQNSSNTRERNILTKPFNNQSIDIVTDYYSYGIGQIVKVSGVLKNNSNSSLGNGEVLIKFQCIPSVSNIDKVN